MKKTKINFDFKKFVAKQKESDWQKSVYVLLLIATFSLIGMLAYIYLSKPSTEIIERVNEEISVESIKIDTKTLESILAKEYLN